MANGSASEPMISTERVGSGHEAAGIVQSPRVGTSNVRAPRAEPREIVELRQLKLEQPELAAAVDMQIALVEIQRRVQARVPLPWIQPDPAWLAAQQAAGRPAVRFGDIPLEWSDLRLTLRQTADTLQRYEALERAEHAADPRACARRRPAPAARRAVVPRHVRRGR